MHVKLSKAGPKSLTLPGKQQLDNHNHHTKITK